MTDNEKMTYTVDEAAEQLNISRTYTFQLIGAGYDLRHTAITYQVEKGYPVHRIADWAGTSEPMIIDVYRHKLDEITDLGPSNGHGQQA